MLLVLGIAMGITIVGRTKAADPPSYDLVVYGGTSAGVIAAVQAKQLGKSVIIVGPDQHLGGLSSGGLGYTDTGNKAVIGGLARDFYHRVWLGVPEAGDLEMAEACRVWWQRARDHRDGRRESNDVDLRTPRGRESIRRLCPRIPDSGRSQ